MLVSCAQFQIVIHANQSLSLDLRSNRPAVRMQDAIFFHTLPGAKLPPPDPFLSNALLAPDIGFEPNPSISLEPDPSVSMSPPFSCLWFPVGNFETPSISAESLDNLLGAFIGDFEKRAKGRLNLSLAASNLSEEAKSWKFFNRFMSSGTNLLFFSLISELQRRFFKDFWGGPLILGPWFKSYFRGKWQDNLHSVV